MEASLHSNLVQFKLPATTILAINPSALHSNLVQFKRDGILFRATAKLLYIPIWYNSSLETVGDEFDFIYLYIPIWYNSSDHEALALLQEEILYIPIWYNSSTGEDFYTE